MLLNHFVNTSQKLYNLEREVTVDELVIPYKRKYCNFRQYMREKPVRFGLKLWCLASSRSRYVYNLNVFLWKGTGKGAHGLGYTMCTDFLKPFAHRGHILVCDKFFSSPYLFTRFAGGWNLGMRDSLLGQVVLAAELEARTKQCTQGEVDHPHAPASPNGMPELARL
jgi:hypothetical protein